MPRLRLTKRLIDAIAESSGRVTYWDDKLSGFGVRVAPGGVKIYVLKYRADGRQRFYKIGRHGSPWTPDAARDKALELLDAVAKGRDPAGARASARAALTFAELCDLYFAEGVAHKKPRTIKSDLTRARLHLAPTLGRLRADAVGRADIERMMALVIKGATVPPKPKERQSGSVPTGGKGVAAQCVALASTILEFAVRRGLRPDNPAKGIRKPPVRKLERYLSTDELSALSTSLDAELASSNAVHSVAAIRLLALTGCRLGEVMNLRWAEVDDQRRLLHLRDSKTREKAVYLSEPAADLLRSVPRFHANEFVFPGQRTGKATSAINRVWSRVRKRADLADVRLHDLRHTFASVGAGASIGLPLIGKLLGHTQASTTARYAHLADNPVRRAADAIGASIAAAMQPSKAAIAPRISEQGAQDDETRV